MQLILVSKLIQSLKKDQIMNRRKFLLSAVTVASLSSVSGCHHFFPRRPPVPRKPRVRKPRLPRVPKPPLP